MFFRLFLHAIAFRPTRAEPTRVEPPHHLSVEPQRLATPELKRRLLVHAVLRRRLLALLANRPHVAGECLDCRSRQHGAQLGEMGTACDAGQKSGRITAKVAEEIEPDKGTVGRIGGFALTGIGNPFRRRFGVDDIKVTIDGNAQPEFMNRQAVRPDARRKRDIARLVIGQASLDIPQAVVTLVGFRSNCASMSQLTGYGLG